MRLLSAAGAAAFVALALAASASAGLWIDLDRSSAWPGQVVHGTAVSGCSVCGPGPVYLVNVDKFGGPELLKTRPSKGDPLFVSVGRFDWKQGGRFAFTVPHIPTGDYLLVFFYRNGSAWSVFPASTVVHVTAPRAATSLGLSEPPRLGVTCGNSTTCDRIGIAVWVKRPAMSVHAELMGARIRMHEGGTTRAGGQGPKYWEGFVQIDRHRLGLPAWWDGSKPVRFLVLHLTMRYANGTVQGAVRTQLLPGWG